MSYYTKISQTADSVTFENGWAYARGRSNANVTLDTSNLTELETEVMINMRINEYTDCMEHSTWAFVAYDNCFNSLDAKKARGAMSSLIKKGYIYYDDFGNDSVIGFEDKGRKLFSDWEQFE